VTSASSQLAEHLFRREVGRMVSSLVRVLGTRHLALVEDAVQDTLVRALETWKFGQLPASPGGWLLRSAHHRAIDLLRRQGRQGRLAPDLERALGGAAAGEGEAGEPHAIIDDELRLMFSCCDPELPPAAQVAVILKYLCGFSVREIAQGSLTSEAAVEKQLFRARRILEARQRLIEVCEPGQVRERLHPVRSAIYLLFSEGYHGAHPQQAVREDLCHEALRLAVLLSRLPSAGGPETRAMVALFCLLAARLAARVDDHGQLLLLAEQDRSRWDRALIAEGLRWLARSAAGEELTAWHLEAAIAAGHATAPTFEATDWGAIRRLYDRLLRLDPSPVVALNRAIAVGMAESAEAGLRALLAIEDRDRLARSPFLPAAHAEFELRAGRPERAVPHLETALRLARNGAERALFSRKLAACRA
jgi:RNA polymerase sigma-70 factor (ECF subfamily)